MKALKSHPHIERPRRISDRINLARHTAGLLLALIGLISAALMKAPIQLVSAETVALGWSYTGSLNTPRASHTATLLPDGKVLVAGGLNISGGDQSLDSAELYDPATGKWNATGRLNVPRVVHTATLLKDGKVLIVGGGVDNGWDYDGLNGAELYDPQNERWSVTGSLNTPRVSHTATLLKNGKVLVVGGAGGGWPLDTVELYDPDTGVWSFTGNLNTAVAYHTATLLQNGKVLVLGGRSAELYDPETGTWSSVGIPGGNIWRSGYTATLLPDGRVLIVGGDSISPAQLYDPDTGAWSSTGDLNETRFNPTATLLPDGKVLVAGGWRPVVRGRHNYGPVSVSSSELYDPDKGTWSFAGSFKTQRSYHTATLLPDGIPLIVGGVWFPFPGDGSLPGDGSPTRSLDSVELGNTFVTLPKITMASIAGKKLFVVGENFDSGAVILINGLGQKTTNDSENPQTRLIGKKAGKKKNLKPGDRIQVRNPSGNISEEFIFTGS